MIFLTFIAAVFNEIASSATLQFDVINFCDAARSTAQHRVIVFAHNMNISTSSSEIYCRPGVFPFRYTSFLFAVVRASDYSMWAHFKMSLRYHNGGMLKPYKISPGEGQLIASTSRRRRSSRLNPSTYSYVQSRAHRIVQEMNCSATTPSLQFLIEPRTGTLELPASTKTQSKSESHEELLVCPNRARLPYSEFQYQNEHRPQVPIIMYPQ